ncbi:MAG: D-alanyl-D-alanine carboxypeptidase [Muribaculaceae bacterium]|nr:D-alanyl-D-alanine carboxypeptidase [Muribaculaceae bacterium]
MKKIIIFFAALLVSASFVRAQDSMLGIDGEESTSVGIYIKEISTGRVLVNRNSQMALTPASVMKAITSASVLSLEGADRRFETRVALRGSDGGNGTWNGDVVVHGVADPTLESENFKSRRGFCDSIVASLRRKGISRIAGTVIVEQHMSDAGPILQWELEDIAWPYGAGLYGFNWRDNTVTVYPNTGRISPEAPGLTMDVRRSNTGNDLVRGVYSDRLMVFSRNTRADWAVRTTVPDPAAVFGAELASKLTAAGISAGSVAESASTDSETPLYTHRSAPFAEILRSLMVRSDNLFAEGMLRSLAPDGRRKDAIAREKELWATRGVSPRYTIINDGSGLTRANRLSARFIGDVLEWMATSPEGETYAGFFPRAGKEGTMRGMLAKSQLKGRIALKTGSVSTVQCYAGYKLDAEGKPTHVIVVLVNGFFCPRSQVRKGTERLLERTFL